MKLMKKVVLASVPFLLAACGNGESSTEEVTQSEQSSEETTKIVFARGVDTSVATEKFIEAFEESHPHIEVEFREMPSDTGEYHDQLVTAFSSQSSEIDIFLADTIWPAEFAQANYALELDRFIEKDDVDMDAHFDGPVKAGNFDGRQWAMPFFVDAGVFFYRTDIVDEAPETWDDLIEAANQYKGEEGTQFGYLMQASQYEGMVTNAIEFIASYGGKIIDENNNVVADSPETIKGIEKMVEVVQSDFVPENINSFTEIETENAWVQGESVFARNWPYLMGSSNNEEVSEIVGNVSMTTLPSGDEGSASALGGWMLMINRYSENPEAAWEFVNWLSGEEGQKINSMNSTTPPTLSKLYDDEDIQNVSPLFADPEFREILHNSVPRPVTPIYPEVSDILQIELSKAINGDQSAEDTARNIQEKIENALNE